MMYKVRIYGLVNGQEDLIVVDYFQSLPGAHNWAYDNVYEKGDWAEIINTQTGVTEMKIYYEECAV